MSVSVVIQSAGSVRRCFAGKMGNSAASGYSQPVCAEMHKLRDERSLVAGVAVGGAEEVIVAAAELELVAGKGDQRGVSFLKATGHLLDLLADVGGAGVELARAAGLRRHGPVLAGAPCR